MAVTGGTVKLRARWFNPPPQEGDFFASARPRFVYRIVDIRRISPRANRRAYSYVLTCERWHPEDIPKTATVKPWCWDKRQKRQRR